MAEKAEHIKVLFSVGSEKSFLKHEVIHCDTCSHVHIAAVDWKKNWEDHNPYWICS